MLGRGVNDLPWEKKGLPGGPEVRGNYTEISPTL